jgi:carbonic anhydrase
MSGEIVRTYHDAVLEVSIMASTVAGQEQNPVTERPHNVLLLSCMDLRLLDEIVAYMDGRNLTDRYDHVILAGAALGVMSPATSHWGQTFWDHLALARELHDVAEVHILEHRDCGAYRKLLGLDFTGDPDAEARKHAEFANMLRSRIAREYPTLAVRCFLMDLDGRVSTL